MITRAMVLAAAIAILIGTGCATRRDALSPPEKAPAKQDLTAVRAIAEEGFIYGLPIVMNYAVMYMYCVDR
ncbi:MAG: hypothetical protein MUC33_22345, partial [Desulfobacterales bacterium]|nr:hypothetical protein [Desulfobacterales bacterium]